MLSHDDTCYSLVNCLVQPCQDPTVTATGSISVKCQYGVVKAVYSPFPQQWAERPSSGKLGKWAVYSSGDLVSSASVDVNVDASVDANTIYTLELSCVQYVVFANTGHVLCLLLLHVHWLWRSH